MSLPITGVYCAAATPIRADLSPDLEAFAAHCRWLIAEGCTGVALLGTTGEANSFSSAERKAILESALAAGLTPDQLLPGTGVANIPETIDLTRHALAQGVSRVVMLPPFYYKGVSDEGLYAAYARVIEGIADDRLRIVLYHIPQMSGVAISHELIERLRAAFPQTVVGIKDSAGKLDNMQAMIARFPGFSVLAGADPLLLPLMQMGGAGCITATSNLVARDLALVYAGANDPAQTEAVARAQTRIEAFRNLSNSYVQLPAIKGMIRFQTGNPGWSRLRPPLMELSEAERADLRAKLLTIGADVQGN
ncbi:MAG: dihydrodipicolinate synthase family protein [Cypionkella sp.]|jgi:4-hydroxy-tetrahydrodipicolinate synthase